MTQNLGAGARRRIWISTTTKGCGIPCQPGLKGSELPLVWISGPDVADEAEVPKPDLSAERETDQ